jgi:hypothetical protein
VLVLDGYQMAQFINNGFGVLQLTHLHNFEYLWRNSNCVQHMGHWVYMIQNNSINMLN